MVRLTALVLAALLAAPSSLHAGEAAENWKLACDAHQRCQLSLAKYSGDALVTRVLIYSVGHRPVLEYTLPLSIDLQRGVDVAVGGEVFATKMLFCKVSGCVGFAPLNDALLHRLETEDDLRLVFSPHGNRQMLTFKFPLAGFKAHYQAFDAARRLARIAETVGEVGALRPSQQ